MKKLGEVSLGIVTGLGGYLDISSLVTSAQAGALFGEQLSWPVIAGGICAAFPCEQGGRLAAVSGRTVSDAIRERFGFSYHAALFVVVAVVTLLILAIEIGGVSVANAFVTGVPFAWWALLVAFVCCSILWKAAMRSCSTASRGRASSPCVSSSARCCCIPSGSTSHAASCHRFRSTTAPATGSSPRSSSARRSRLTCSCSTPPARSRTAGTGAPAGQPHHRGGAKMGRIDSIVIGVDDDGPPTVVAVECGPVPLAARIHPRLAA